MHSNFFKFYEEMGATARAKNEALAARAAFVTGVMEQGYRLWLTLLTTEVSEAVKAAQDLSTCTNPNEVAEVQRAWFQASSARAITSLQGTIEIANFLVKNLQETMATLPAAAAAAAAALPAGGPTPSLAAPAPALGAPAPAPTPALAAPAPAPLQVAPPQPVVKPPAPVQAVPPAAKPAKAGKAQAKPAKV